jgi:lysozyme
MTPRHQVTKAAIALIKQFEGFRSRAARLPDGRWTIGYSHTRTAREGAEITEADADALLIYDLSAVIAAVNEWVFTPLTQNQFDALVAFAFNIGLPNFRRSSVLRRLNEGAHLQAACAMEMWRTADFEGERIVIDALVRRRSAEMALYLTPVDGPVPVPSLIVLPRVDDAVARNAPSRTVQIETPLESELAEVYRTDEPLPSAGLAAAAAVSARLNTLLQDIPPARVAVETAPIMPVEDQPAHAAAQDAEAALAPPENTEPHRDLYSSVQPDNDRPAAIDPAHLHAAYYDEAPLLAADLGGAEPDAASEDRDLSPRPIAFSLPPRGALSERANDPGSRKKARARTPGPVLALLGVIGLAVFTAGILWAFNAKASPRFANLPDPLMAGWAMGLVGVALAASSVYLLLRRMGAKGD